MALGPREAILLVGVIHGVWHWPSILMGSDYGFGYWGTPVVGPLLFVVMACLTSAFYAWVTLRSGSVWPAAFGHGVINASAMLMAFFIRGAPDALIGPLPVGIIGSLGYAVLALAIMLSRGALAPSGSERPVEPPAVEVASQGAAI